MNALRFVCQREIKIDVCPPETPRHCSTGDGNLAKVRRPGEQSVALHSDEFVEGFPKHTTRIRRPKVVRRYGRQRESQPASAQAP